VSHLRMAVERRWRMANDRRQKAERRRQKGKGRVQKAEAREVTTLEHDDDRTDERDCSQRTASCGDGRPLAAAATGDQRTGCGQGDGERTRRTLWPLGEDDKEYRQRRPSQGGLRISSRRGAAPRDADPGEASGPGTGTVGKAAVRPRQRKAK